jgi:hypothetical protein
VPAAELDDRHPGIGEAGVVGAECDEGLLLVAGSSHEVRPAAGDP